MVIICQNHNRFSILVFIRLSMCVSSYHVLYYSVTLKLKGIITSVFTSTRMCYPTLLKILWWAGTIYHISSSLACGTLVRYGHMTNGICDMEMYTNGYLTLYTL